MLCIVGAGDGLSQKNEPPTPWGRRGLDCRTGRTDHTISNRSLTLVSTGAGSGEGTGSAITGASSGSVAPPRLALKAASRSEKAAKASVAAANAVSASGR